MGRLLVPPMLLSKKKKNFLRGNSLFSSKVKSERLFHSNIDDPSDIYRYCLLFLWSGKMEDEFDFS